MNDSVIRSMRSLVDPHAIEVDDTTLLQRFVGLGDSEAFELLLWRHIGLVRQTCRAVLRDRHAAEDVVQAVFLVLARKAGSIQEGTSCAGWLHRTAYRASLRASSILRNKRTVTMTDIGVIVEPASPEPIAFPMSEVVHEEIDRLPRKYRMPIVLCYLEGLSQSEAAERLGWPVGTVNGRIGRAKQMLESRLLRRGIRFVLTASLLAVEKGDAAFVSRTLRAALMYARGLNSTSGISPLTLSLANGVIRSMLFKQFQIVASLVTLAGVMVFGIAFAGADEPHQIPKTPLPASAPTPPQSASAVVKKIQVDDATITKYKKAGAKFYGLVPIADADFLGGSRKLKDGEGKPYFRTYFRTGPSYEILLGSYETQDDEDALPCMSFEVVSPVDKDLPAITVPHALRLHGVEVVSKEAANDERFVNEHRSQIHKRLKTLLDSKTLTHLEISGNVCEALGDDFTFPPDLETLWLNNVYLSSPELKKIVEKIVQLHHLKTLVLDIAITDSEVALLAKMTTLERVAIGAVRPETQSEIVNNDLEPALSNSALVELAKLKNLTTLFVGGRFSKKGIQELGTLSKLQTLGVFSTEKVDSLAALSQLENLTTLSLTMVPMWDFADFVGCKRLRVLQLELKSFPTHDEMVQIANMSSLEHLRVKWVNQDFNRLRGLRLLKSSKLHSLHLTGRFEISGVDEIETLSGLKHLGIGKSGAIGGVGIDSIKLPEEYRDRLGKLTEIEYIDY